jgi:hypothetical protein
MIDDIGLDGRGKIGKPSTKRLPITEGMSRRNVDSKSQSLENNTFVPIKIITNVIWTKDGESILKLPKVFGIEARETNSGKTGVERRNVKLLDKMKQRKMDREALDTTMIWTRSFPGEKNSAVLDIENISDVIDVKNMHVARCC